MTQCSIFFVFCSQVISYHFYIQQSEKSTQMFGISITQKERKIYQNISTIKSLISKALQDFSRDSQKQLNTSSTLTKHKSEETIDASEEIYVIKSLKKGYIMTKHSQNSKSKSKFVYLSFNEKYLCWKSVDKQDQKRLEVSTIYNIVRNGSEYMIKKNKNIKNIENCVVLMAQSRTLFLEAQSISEANYFEQEMQKVLRYCQKMSLNYLYTND